MQLEQIALTSSELHRVFPFHVVVSKVPSDPIISVGVALQKITGNLWRNVSFGDLFELTRPRNTDIDLDALSASDRTFVLKHKHSELSLRGLFIAMTDNQFLFVCSVEVTTQHTLQDLGLSIKDFAPADPTPDIIILHQFREMQQNDQQQQIEQLRQLIVARDTFDRHANTDVLTGIGNRRHFWTQGARMLDEISDDHETAILLMDLDGFKKINDTYGHDVGDIVLQTVAKRCEYVVSSHGVVSRLGGDEFVALFQLENTVAVDKLINDLREVICEPMICMNRRLSVRPSMGVSTLNHTQTMDEAIHYADLAMYEGRKKERGIISWFTPEMQVSEDYRKSLLADISQAIQSREFIPYFQPIIDIQHQSIHGYEALARWQHPAHGLIFPDVFIEIAAESGCLHELDYYILESALDQLTQWDKQHHCFSIHVNLCGTSVREGLDNKIMSLLLERDIDPSRLMLELTETTLLDFEEEEQKVLYRLNKQGVVIQLDDFGTGYSSLTHLHDFPVTGVKLDRSFLFDFPHSKRCLALIESVMGIARHLDMAAVTEGIETWEQLYWIESIGCRYGQGYLFGKPVSADQCQHTLKRWQVGAEKAA